MPFKWVHFFREISQSFPASDYSQKVNFSQLVPSVPLKKVELEAWIQKYQTDQFIGLSTYTNLSLKSTYIYIIAKHMKKKKSFHS